MKKELLIFGGIVVVLSTILLIALFSKRKEDCKCLQREIVDAPSQSSNKPDSSITTTQNTDV